MQTQLQIAANTISVERICLALERLVRTAENINSRDVTNIIGSLLLNWADSFGQQDLLPPRLSNDLPRFFIHGIPPQESQRLDYNSNTTSDYNQRVDDFVATIKNQIEYLLQFNLNPAPAVYQDRIMLSLSLFSRFLSTTCLDNIKDIQAKQPRHYLHPFEQYKFWEFWINQALIAWDENIADNYISALKELLLAIDIPPHERANCGIISSMPLRPYLGLRHKIIILKPSHQEQRVRPNLDVKLRSVIQRLNNRVLSYEQLYALLNEIILVENMLKNNLFILHAKTSFGIKSSKRRLREKISFHPYLYNFDGFYKDALLFANGTYSLQSDSADNLFLELKRLQRLINGYGKIAFAQLRPHLEQAILSWECNALDEFKLILKKLATNLRKTELPNDQLNLSSFRNTQSNHLSTTNKFNYARLKN